MSKKFKVGDVVTVRSDVRAYKYYRMDDGSNGMHMTEQQAAKAGKTVKIKSITKTGKYMIEGSIFPWVDEMFEDKPITKSTGPRFKVGDKVRVRSDLKVGGKYCMADGKVDDSFVGSMRDMCGKVVTIKRITDFGKYSIEECIWNWTDEMFEPEVVNVKKTEKSKKTETKFKVGDKVIGKKGAPYGITREGWTGIVCQVYDNGQIGVEKTFNPFPYTVDPKWFDLVDETPKWRLSITGDGDITTAEYVGPNGETALRTVKRYHADQFDIRAAVTSVIDKVLPVKTVKPAEYTVVGVVFEKGGQVYNYLDNGLKVEPGMVVKVPVGKNNNLRHAVVTSVETHTLKSSPYPISKMKNVAEIEDFTGWKFVCTKADASFWTKGKIYPVTDGKVYDDDGDQRTLRIQFGWNRFISPKELNLCGTHLIKVTE